MYLLMIKIIDHREIVDELIIIQGKFKIFKVSFCI